MFNGMKRPGLRGLVLLLLVILPIFAFGFPFWLSAPNRSNPNDPKSPDYVTATPTTVPTPAFTNTYTPTKTFTPGTPSPTATPGMGPVLLENFPAGGANDDWNIPITIWSSDTVWTGVTASGATTWGAGDQSCGATSCAAGGNCYGLNPEPGTTESCASCIN